MYHILNFKIEQMKDFTKLYETAKLKANKLMAKGQIGQYVKALKEMNQYKQMMLVVSAN